MPIIIMKQPNGNKMPFDANDNIFFNCDPGSIMLLLCTQKSPTTVASAYMIPHLFVIGTEALKIR